VTRKKQLPNRRLRADAARNRIAILEAAEAVFVKSGRALSTEEVAVRAGVGVGTVFRHFPTREALLQALLQARLDALAREADAFAVDDRGEALFAFFEHLAEQSVKKRALVEALDAAGVNKKAMLLGAGERFHAAVARLVARAQAKRVVRSDVTVADIVALLLAVAHAADQGAWDKATLRRTLGVVIDGLRGRRR
jgi:AcrR family transcriptional regulator